MGKTRGLATGFFHFCGMLGKIPIKTVIGPMALCPICHSRAMTWLQTDQLGQLLEKYDNEAREVWKQTKKEARYEKETHFTLFVRKMREKGFVIPLDIK